MTQSPQRLKWIDIARGIGIILVVYAHAARGLVQSGTLPETGWPLEIDTVIYAFHMPLFFILAGLNMERGVARSRMGFVLNKLQTVAWPYFLWSFLHGGLKLASARYTNNPITVADLLAIPVVPIEQFWFLYVLFLCQLLVAVVLPRRWLLVLLTAAGVALWWKIADASIFFRTLHYLPYIVAGLFVPPLLAWLAERRAWQAAVAAGALIVFAMLILPVGAPAQAPTLIYALASLGSLFTIALSMMIARAEFSIQWLETLGRLSMPIFLMHTIFSAATRAGLKLVGLADPIAILGLVTAAGLILPILAYRVAAFMKITGLLGFGPPIAR